MLERHQIEVAELQSVPFCIWGGGMCCLLGHCPSSRLGQAFVVDVGAGTVGQYRRLHKTDAEVLRY